VTRCLQIGGTHKLMHVPAVSADFSVGKSVIQEVVKPMNSSPTDACSTILFI